MAFGPIRQKDFGTVLDTTLAAAPVVTSEVESGGFSDFVFGIDVSSYSAITSLSMTIETSLDGITWYDMVNASGEVVEWTKTIAGNESWVWLVSAAAAQLRATFTPVGDAGETLTVGLFADAAKNIEIGNAAAGGGGGAGGGGWIIISDVAPQGAGVVDNKVYQDTGNTVLQSCDSYTVDIEVSIKSSYPKVRVSGSDYELSLVGDLYSGTVNVTIPASTTDLEVQVITPDESVGPTDTVRVAYEAPPEILTLSFTGGYPGSQTELKAGDTFQITGTTDKDATGVRILDLDACQLSEPTFAASTVFTVTGTIADRGDVAQLLPAHVQAKNAAGAYGSSRATNAGGGSVDGTDVVNCNDLYPSVSIGAITYPPTQGALKGSETATIVNTVSDYTAVVYDSPTAELSITNPTTLENPKTVQRIAGTYNDSTNNFRITANRAANDATTVDQEVVEIANVAPTIDVSTPAARLRSGGNDGTSIQNHTITIDSDQQLDAAPTLNEDTGGGTFTGSWSGGPLQYTRTLQVHDDDVKGAYTWQGLVATNKAGLVQNTINTGSSYTLGGFVARTVTFPAFSQTVNINVEVITYTKLQAGIFTSTNQPAVRHTPQGDHSDATDEYTVDSLATNPTAVWWNDVAAAAANSSGTAQLTDIEETV